MAAQRLEQAESGQRLALLAPESGKGGMPFGIALLLEAGVEQSSSGILRAATSA